MRRTPLVVAGLAMTALLSACDPNDHIAPAGPASGACMVGAADCQDGAFGHQANEDDARSLLGRREDELPDDVRIARDGTEWYALTEDYVVGRLTVELDPDGDGVSRVVLVTLEDEDGPKTFEADA